MLTVVNKEYFKVILTALKHLPEQNTLTKYKTGFQSLVMKNSNMPWQITVAGSFQDNFLDEFTCFVC